MNEWEMRTLGDVLSLRRETWKVGDEPCKYVGLEHIGVASLRLSAIGYSKDVESNKSKFGPENILFGKLRPYFRKVINPNFHGICSSDIWVFDVHQDASKDFMFYFVADERFVQLATVSSGGTRMPRADWSYLSELEFYFPPLEEQEAIAEVLSSLDDKIDLLKRQNKTLEGMAEALFRSYKELAIKEDCCYVKLGDISSICLGGTPSRQRDDFWGGNIPWINSGELNSNRIVRATEYITSLGYECSSTKFMRKGSTVIAITGTTMGKCALLEDDFCGNQSIVGVTAEDEINDFLLFILINDNMDELLSCATGAAQPHINKNDVQDLEVIDFRRFPELPLLSTQLSVFSKRISANVRTILNLESQRDTLIPKLMSGEVRVRLD
jgi:type I restriction enzyme S subunit